MQMTLRISQTSNRIAFRDRVKALKDLGARYDGATKAWTIDTETGARPRIAVWRDYAEYEGMDDEAIVRTALRVGGHYTEVEG